MMTSRLKKTIFRATYSSLILVLTSCFLFAYPSQAQDRAVRSFILPQAEKVSKLSLKQALAMAMLENWQQKILLAQTTQQGTIVPKAWSTLLPQIQANANYTQNYPEQTVSFQNQGQIEAQATLYESIGDLMLRAAELEVDEDLKTENEQNAAELLEYADKLRASAAEPVVVQPSNFFNAQVNLALPLFDARAFPLLQNAYTSVQVNQLANEDAKTKILYNVVVAYWNAVLAKSQFDLATESLKRAKTLAIMAQKKVALGAAPSLEKERAQLQVLSAERQVTQSSYNKEIAIGYLGLLIGSPVAFEVIEPPTTPPVTKDLDYYIDHAKKHRFDLRIQDQNIIMADRDLRASYYSFLPRLQLIGRGSYTDNTRGFMREPYSAAVILQASIPLFEGGSRFATLKEKRAKLLETKLQKQKMTFEIDAEIRSSFKSLETEKASLSIQKKTVDVAQKAYDQSTTLYEVGKIAQTEVINSLEDLKQSQQAYQASLLQLETGYYTLYLATGTFMTYLKESLLVE